MLRLKEVASQSESFAKRDPKQRVNEMIEPMALRPLRRSLFY
jgi:hypothetical protein